MTTGVQKTSDLIKRQVRNFFDVCHLRISGLLNLHCHLRIKSQKTKDENQKLKAKSQKLKVKR